MAFTTCQRKVEMVRVAVINLWGSVALLRLPVRWQ